MAELYGMIADVVPDLESRKGVYQVDAMELDDELREAFLEQLDINNDGIRKGVREGDLEAIASTAHSIKGMGGTIGKPEMSVLGEELESAAKAGDEARCGRLAGVVDEWLRLFREQTA